MVALGDEEVYVKDIFGSFTYRCSAMSSGVVGVVFRGTLH